MVNETTEQAHAKQQLRLSEARLRAVIEATPECIKLIAPDGTLIEMNPVGLDMIEADGAEEVVGRSVYDIIAPEHRDAFREFHEHICRGESGRLQFDIIGLRGKRRTMESDAVPLTDGDGGLLHLAVTRDVSERNRIETERGLLAALVESSDDIIASKSLEGILMTWNKGAEGILGGSRDSSKELLSVY